MFIPKFYPSINYDVRPDSYWGPAASPLEAALRNVKGRNRRQMIRDYHAKGLIRFLDAVEHPEAEPEWKRFGFVLSFNETNLCCGAELETLEDFTSVASDFYPELGQHYTRAIDEWRRAHATEPAGEK